VTGKERSNVHWMVDRARGDAFFLGTMLSEYQEANSLDDLGLAAALQCDPHALSRLALCRCPDDRHASFAQEVHAIATFATCSADALMQLLRQVAATRALRAQGAESTSGLLMAARDRHEGEQREKSGTPPTRKRRGPRNDK
jgi:hypothetical protein